MAISKDAHREIWVKIWIFQGDNQYRRDVFFIFLHHWDGLRKSQKI